jgi:hypothetical protein
MTPREFFNAWKGFDKYRKNEWDVLFWLSKYNALRTTWSKEQANQILLDKPPWKESGNKKSKKEVSPKAVMWALNMISKPKENG